jgi:hypothetical protein
MNVRFRKRHLLAIPVAVVAMAVCVFVWGQLQPRPDGFAPTEAALPVTASVEPEVHSSDAAASAETSLSDMHAEADVEPATWLRFTVDARDRDRWVLVDLDRGVVIDESSFSGADWDFAFRRTGFRTNSGVTNPSGAVGVADLGEIEPETATPRAAATFEVDAPAGEDGDDVQNAAVGKWYSYNFIRHVVLPHENVYQVRTSDGGTVLVTFESYYCADDSPGCVTFRYVLLDGGLTDTAAVTTE